MSLLYILDSAAALAMLCISEFKFDTSAGELGWFDETSAIWASPKKSNKQNR